MKCLSSLQVQQRVIATPKARLASWKEVGITEMKNFLGLYILAGIHKLPQFWMYWSTAQVLQTPIFPKTMTRNNFQRLLRCVHFAHGGDNDTDRMWRVRPFLDRLIPKFQQLFYPGQNIAIDEGMLLWRGQLVFKVYNPLKPIKYGIKSYVLCDSITGYCYAMKPYHGKSSKLIDTVLFLLGDLKGRGHHLFMDNYYNSVDTSVQLLALDTHTCGTLRKRRGEPQAIKDLTLGSLKAGEHVMVHNGKAMIVVWRDKKLVKCVSTIHPDQMLMTEHRLADKDKDKEKAPRREKVIKPKCVLEYNKYMHGVDSLDQQIGYYMCARKSQKWTTKFCFYLIQIALYNAYVLYRTSKENFFKEVLKKNPKAKKPTILSHLKFILAVTDSWVSVREGRCGTDEVQPAGGQEAEELESQDEAGAQEAEELESQDEAGGQEAEDVELESQDEAGGQEEEEVDLEWENEAGAVGGQEEEAGTARSNRYDPPQRLDAKMGPHKPVLIPSKAGARKRPSRPCRVCMVRFGKRKAGQKGPRKESRYWCQECKVPLHMQDCFDEYHSLKQYGGRKKKR